MFLQESGVLFSLPRRNTLGVCDPNNPEDRIAARSLFDAIAGQSLVLSIVDEMIDIVYSYLESGGVIQKRRSRCFAMKAPRRAVRRRLRSPSPIYSPTSPTYSPTSPTYSPNYSDDSDDNMWGPKTPYGFSSSSSSSSSSSHH